MPTNDINQLPISIIQAFLSPITYYSDYLVHGTISCSFNYYSRLLFYRSFNHSNVNYFHSLFNISVNFLKISRNINKSLESNSLIFLGAMLKPSYFLKLT